MQLVRIRKALLACEVVRTQKLREEGLKGRSGLRPSEGMVFEFDRPQKLVEMTMQGVSFPIDMIFVGTDGCVEKIDGSVAPGKHVVRCARVVEVIEAPAGFCKKHRIDVGDAVVRVGSR